ncbi:TIR domain-containing protein [Cupriavidus basilensis]|uniref:Uncharacterized protein n=1 Tax=Cupriavidus basilensis TaxID=68895 RepID=A0A7M2HBW0_9BURK|nr:TIR domain-containing protein [Cupriavidus basilensis]QOT82067.1 hypothetical protein F7R26_037925 [Cupriavidus basilensis]
MVRRVFFGFHYDREVHRIVQIRNSWIVRAKEEDQPFYDKVDFDKAKKRAP